MRWDEPRERSRPQAQPVMTGGLTVTLAVERVIVRRQLAPTTAEVFRANIAKGRFAAFCRDHGIRTVEDLTQRHLDDFLVGVSPTVAPATLKKITQQLRWLVAHLREVEHIDLDQPTVEPPDAGRLVVDEEPPLTRAEVDTLIAAARPGRDRVVVEMLAVTGMRPSEVVGLTVPRVRLELRPPRVEIRGTGHDPRRVKTAAALREVQLELEHRRGFPRRLRHYLEAPVKDGGRPSDGVGSWLFYSDRRTADGLRVPLSTDGLETLLERLGRRAGIHCNAYRFRHSVCSWLADGGLPSYQLMTLMGWKSSRMVDRYYRRRGQEAIEAASRLRF